MFQSYSRKHVHFYGREVPALLELGLALTRDISEKPMMVDLGCGDGRLIFAMYRKELLISVGNQTSCREQRVSLCIFSD
ncbi:MAG: hypothetical protein QXH91_06515 [Candidatus Bathyarchaeia archaeon]